jgi:hypothetical protein
MTPQDDARLALENWPSSSRAGRRPAVSSGHE